MALNPQYIPPEQFQLMKIIKEHYPLLELELKQKKSLEDSLAHIAAYCDIPVDGAFRTADMILLMNKCSQILFNRLGGIILH